MSLQSFSQTITVSGTVINAGDNTPVVGVSVVQQGSDKGTTTNQKGFFSLGVSGSKPVLLFSSVGFQTYTLTWDGTSAITIKLEPEVAALQDVVVVGYGTQKKINQTGATQTLKLDDAVNQPVTNSSQLMYGKFSGVQLTQGNGLPGADGSTITIRGVGTFGSVTPLVVIDNIQYSGLEVFNNLAPSDIETISVLKDASASAIYGARGANGVIVVTTKKGKSGAMSVIYNSYTGFQEITVVPKYLNAVQYATLKNEKDINANTSPNPTPIRYTQANIQAIIDGSNPDQYANTNWANEILRRAPIQNHYLAFSGGNDKTTYRVSLGYLNQEAIVRGKFKNERFNLSLNINSNVKSWLTISNVTNMYWTRFKGPSGGADAITGETGIINQFQRSAPTIPAYYSNGAYGIVDGSYLYTNFSFPSTNPLQRGVLGDYSSDDINIAERFGVKVDFNKHLSFETSGSVNMSFGNTSNFSPTNSTYDWAGNLVGQTAVNTLNNGTSFNYRLLNENILRYGKKFGDRHDLSVLLGHSVIYNRNDGFSGSLQSFPTNALQEFDAGGVLNPNVAGSASEESVQSFFSRINYIYDGKYLLEFNVRRDGSSKFGPNNRYANFPSASAGWRISDEKFMRKVGWISDLKLRASWGITGNDNIGNYIFDQTYNAGLDYFLGTNTIVSAVAVTRLANSTIRWEKVEQYDIGLDAGFFRNRLSVTADYFKRMSSDVLYGNFPVPASIGVTSLAAQNSASMLNSGVELAVNYRGNFKGLNYSVGASMSKFADNQVTGLGDRGLETINNESIIRIGVPFNAYFGYKTLGIFQTAAEVAAAPKQFGSNLTAPGDIRYADLSGPEGKPDGVINAMDRTVIGNPYPSMIYNFNTSLSYKGFDFNVVFEGLNGLDRILNDNGQTPMEGDRNNALSYWTGRWTPQNPSAKLPRLGGVNNSVISDFYVEDVSYLRMRNLEIGYTLPLRLSEKAGMSKLRIYVGGQNLLTFTKLENFDPERARGGNTDQLAPLYKVYTIGLNVKF
ncbi:SusC/RagA family TonB-linked outer membrane protein [Lacibacter sediminis]|uniref:TonB-dependent receptor n=1 Tax=Lacibacter sediminis TaxID=2760713 RepID=A0A7G5XKJ3_9BACT|nr:TonB-dependent receptor [Lacibacter sediminis]QNA45996.1 TonB-dependent receptor [Lacibacter sediminis]